ncbi:MAG: cytochrome C family protein [Parcubacteria group bacterium Gr01-1014_30]|nr:MAG: cytochrome C family protein [Parcubacteria group bacterium Gr01-1014_30]
MVSLILASVLVFSGLFFFQVKAQTTATLALSPTSGSVAVNQTFTVNIALNTAGAPADGVDIYMLRFNPSVLQVVDADSAVTGVQIGAGTLMPNTVYNAANNTAGTIQFAQSASGGSSFTGSGTLATITFRGIAVGSSNVTFDFTLGSTTDTNVSYQGVDRLSQVTNGSYTVTAAGDTTPPILSNGQPTGTLPSGTTQTTISLNTNESATCRYSTTPGTSYAAMTNTFSTTGGTSHSTLVTGLADATAYNYYVRCQDTAGNATTNDFTISFSIASPSPPPPPPPPAPPPPPPAGGGGGGGGGGGTTDTTPPVISNIRISTSTFSSVTITWQTDEPATSQVEYGKTINYGLYSPLSSALATSHVVIITGLEQEITFYFRAISRDAAGNQTFGSQSIFITTNRPRLLGDFNGDGKVNIFDLSILLSNWKKNRPEYDLNGNGSVDIFDLSILLSNWTK